MRSIRDEVRRDRLVATAALLQETLACANEEIERLLLDGCPPSLPDMPETTAELRVTHMRGDLWTVARDSLVYVFLCLQTTTSSAA